MTGWLPPLLAATLGFAALALSQPKHHREILGGPPPPGRARLLRWSGWALVAACSALCLTAFGVGYGLVALAAVLNAAGLAVALGLAYGPATAAAPRRAGIEAPAGARSGAARGQARAGRALER